MPTFSLTNSLASVPAHAWDALHDGDNPFITHSFLHALEHSGSLRPHWGWVPCHALLHQGSQLIAAAPGYIKRNSHGEFVFDHAWAIAHLQYDLAYYPKWLIGVPYTPVTGPRLLARDNTARSQLLHAMSEYCHTRGWSSIHVNFLPEHETPAFGPEWLEREDVQFHWHNPGWRDFADFLDALTHKRRKAIRQEREKIQRAGISFRIVHGHEASPADLAAMHDFYSLTFQQKGNSPALTLPFFQHLAQQLPRALVLILAQQQNRTIAGALCLRSRTTLYGRYWGSESTLPGLHFETCYYQGIDYCLREGLQYFEPGAQGEHKIARGFLPVITRSRHLITDPQLAFALRHWCREERESTRNYRNLIAQHSPFRHVPAVP